MQQNWNNPQILTPLASPVVLLQRRLGLPLSNGSFLTSHFPSTTGHVHFSHREMGATNPKWVTHGKQWWLQLGRPCNPPRHLQEVCFWHLCLHVERSSFGCTHSDRKDLRLKNWGKRFISRIKPWSLPGYTCRHTQRQKPSCNWGKAFNVPFH